MWWTQPEIDVAVAARYGNSVPRGRGSRPHAPGGRDAGPGRDAARCGGADARGGSAAEPCHLRDHLDGARGAEAHRNEPPSQLHRPRRVPAHGRDRATLHPDTRRSLPRPGQDSRCAHAGFLRGDHARRPFAEMELARPARGRRKACRPAESRLRRRRPRGLGEVLPLLRRRAADRPAPGAQVHDRPR